MRLDLNLDLAGAHYDLTTRIIIVALVCHGNDFLWIYRKERTALHAWDLGMMVGALVLDTHSQTDG